MKDTIKKITLAILIVLSAGGLCASSNSSPKLQIVGRRIVVPQGIYETANIRSNPEVRDILGRLRNKAEKFNNQLK